MERRCPLCKGRSLSETERGLFYHGVYKRFSLACEFCGLLLNNDTGFADILKLRLQADHFGSNPEDGFGFDIYTLRSAATRFCRSVVPDSEAQETALQNPHSDLAASAYLRNISGVTGDAITLAVMCRESDLTSVIAQNTVHLDWARELVVLVNTDDQKPEQQVQDRTRIVTRPFTGDFARQRNHLQDLCATPWVLQLDADETLSPKTAALLPFLAAVARGDGVVSIGLARRNLVDGVLSDLHPDFQYRLNRSSLRYAGKVHERPERPWQASMIALHGAIDHHLSLAHVQSRSARYEALDPGRGRLDEAGELMRPFCG